MKVTVGSLSEGTAVFEHFKALQFSKQLVGLFDL